MGSYAVAVSRIMRAPGGGIHSPVELLDQLASSVGAYLTALKDLERLTRERVVDDPQEVRRRWRQRLLLRRSVRGSGPGADAT
ncbi:hypothetical protein GCM10027261_14250 [Geodermatophilus arenarius]